MGARSMEGLDPADDVNSCELNLELPIDGEVLEDANSGVTVCGQTDVGQHF
jgi:hypothetical protein